MKVSIFGLGYVGCVSAACLASQGHKVMGVDVNADKVNTVKSGKSPVVEHGLEALIKEMVDRGDLTATTDTAAAVAHAEICLICVGTPSRPNGSLDLRYVERVCEEIGRAMAKSDDYKVITFRSTILPGNIATQLIPIIAKESGKALGTGFGATVNPEFLRESTAIEDFKNPPFTVIGEFDSKAGDVLAKMYEGVNAPLYRTAPDVASMVKYACNAYHAVKVTFANEIGQLCASQGIDAEKVMEIFCKDTQLNISARYLRPGFAFGGSCLPKDVRAMVYMARHSDVDVPALEALLPSNSHQIQRVVNMVEATGIRRVAVIGLSFKPNTDDLRESPTVRLVEALLGKGIELSIYDNNVNVSKLVGSSRAYIEQTIPHLSSLIGDTIESVIKDAGVVIAAHGMNEEISKLLQPDQMVINLPHLYATAPAKSLPSEKTLVSA